jgi:methyl-galactoside transport system substrate-binding protein
MTSCSQKSNHISVFYYDKDDIFLNQLSKKLTDNLSKKYSITNYYASKSQLKQNLQVDEALDESSLILMNMVDRLASGAIVEKCRKKNIPVVFFNREPLLEDMESYKDCYYVGPNPDKQGMLQVECAEELFGNPSSLNPKYDLNGDNKIQLVILKGEQGHQDAERRTQACLSTIRQKGYDIELISIGVCNWNQTEAYNLFWSQYNSLLKNAELVLANNDEMAIGAASYIRSVTNEEEDIIPVIGVDATIAGKKAVKDKLLSSTIINDDSMQVEAICQLTDVYMNNMPMEDLNFTIENQKFIYIDSAIYVEDGNN